MFHFTTVHMCSAKLTEEPALKVAKKATGLHHYDVVRILVC